MIDVFGYIIVLVPLLYEVGIRFLYIGVNEASALPNVPKEFLWKNGEAEIVVVYEGTYGSEYKNEYIDDILCFLHSNDNHGPSNKVEIQKIHNDLKKKYPDYEIIPSSIDDYARAIIAVKEKLPVITSEIGDTWIHGVASDPYKSGALRELISLKDLWLENNNLKRTDKAYLDFCDNLLLVAEHTWGMDVKRNFGDYDNYLKTDFKKARAKNTVRSRLVNINKNLYQKTLSRYFRFKGIYKKGSYLAMEKSWNEQRAYIDKAVGSLPIELLKQAKAKLKTLRPLKGFNKGIPADIKQEFILGDFALSFNENGIKTIRHTDDLILDNKRDYATLTYNSYGNDDYDFWKNNYTRNYETTKSWSEPDFLMPGFKYVDKKYPQGKFSYKLNELYLSEKDNGIILCFSIESKLVEDCGAPKTFEIKIKDTAEGLSLEVIWLEKDASRLPESLFINFPLCYDEDKLKYVKISHEIDPYDIVETGNRNLSAVEKINFVCKDSEYSLINVHSPLVSTGEGKILQFDNIFESIKDKGLSFNLYNNIWGTNFPLWYEDNAYFKYILTQKAKKD